LYKEKKGHREAKKGKSGSIDRAGKKRKKKKIARGGGKKSPRWGMNKGGPVLPCQSIAFCAQKKKKTGAKRTKNMRAGVQIHGRENQKPGEENKKEEGKLRGRKIVRGKQTK